MDTQHTRCNRVNPLLHEGCSRPVQPLETTALQRGTGLLIIPWSLVRIQAGPVYFAEYRPRLAGSVGQGNATQLPRYQEDAHCE